MQNKVIIYNFGWFVLKYLTCNKQEALRAERDILPVVAPVRPKRQLKKAKEDDAVIKAEQVLLPIVAPTRPKRKLKSSQAAFNVIRPNPATPYPVELDPFANDEDTKDVACRDTGEVKDVPHSFDSSDNEVELDKRSPAKSTILDILTPKNYVLNYFFCVFADRAH